MKQYLEAAKKKMDLLSGEWKQMEEGKPKKTIDRPDELLHAAKVLEKASVASAVGLTDEDIALLAQLGKS
jgi:hypothetical protein